MLFLIIIKSKIKNIFRKTSNPKIKKIKIAKFKLNNHTIYS